MILAKIVLALLFRLSTSKQPPRKLQEWDQTCLFLIRFMTSSEDERDRHSFFCETVSGEMYQTKFPTSEERLSEIPSGSTVILPNAAVDLENYVIYLTEMPRVVPHDLFRSRRELAETVGIHSCLIVRVTSGDGKTTTFSEEELSKAIFGTDPSTSQEADVSMQKQFYDCSHGKLDFVRAQDKVGSSGSRISNGATTVHVDLPVSVGSGRMANAVTDELNSRFGVETPHDLADYILYCLPPGTMNGVAYAYINHWNSVYNDQWCGMLSSAMHEVGHNLGLGHSNEVGNYEDQSGYMGYSYFEQNWPKMCFNSAKSFQLGWYNNRHLIIGGNVNNFYEGKLSSIVDYPDKIGPPILIKLDTPGDEKFYVNFNFKSNFNVDTQEGGNEVLVVQAGNGIDYSDSELKATLTAGSMFTIPSFENGQDLSIEVISTDIVSGMADVRICIGTCPTKSPTESPSMNPTRAPTPIPTSVPTSNPTQSPTQSPSQYPSAIPTGHPTNIPSGTPTLHPSPSPTQTPSLKPTILQLTSGPSDSDVEMRPWCGTMKHTLRGMFCDLVPSGEKDCFDPISTGILDPLWNLCPQACGVDCDCYDIDEFLHKGKIRDCDWVLNGDKCLNNKFSSYCPRTCQTCSAPGPDFDEFETKSPTPPPTGSPTKSPTNPPAQSLTEIPTSTPTIILTDKPSIKPTLVRRSRSPSSYEERPWCGTLYHHKHTKFCKGISMDKSRCSEPLVDDPDKSVAYLCPLVCELECECYDVSSFTHKGKSQNCSWALNQGKCGKGKKFDSYCPRSCGKC